MPVRPPTGLSVLVTDAGGATTRWGSEDRNPENVPQGITFGTQRMQGFGQGSVTLSRRIDRDYIDVNLLDEVSIIGTDGSVAYEGRINGNPRSTGNQHTIALQGWMGHAKDRKFSMIYVDRDLSRWQGISSGRRMALLNTVPAWSINDPAQDYDSTGLASVRTELTGAWTDHAICEAWYDAGSNNLITSTYYDWAKGVNVSTAASWEWYVIASQTDATAPYSTANLRAVSSTPSYFTPTVPTRYVGLELIFSATGGGAGSGYSIAWRNLAMYGDHGVNGYGTNPPGFYASDVIKHIIRAYCPKLSTAGIQNTTYPIPHLVFRDQTYPYDAFLDINKFHLWDLSVWEDKTAHYKGVDLTDYDWEIRIGDADAPDVQVGLQGDDTGELANGIVVQFENVTTRQTEVLLPANHAELRDDSVDNPYNAHGYPGETAYQISIPTTTDAALQIGRAALAEFNQPKAPGDISTSWHIRDRQGHWQPVWKVRAGDRVAITSSSSLSDRPRVIHETTYSHDGCKLTMAVDSTMKRLDAFIDRAATAIAAAGLT